MKSWMPKEEKKRGRKHEEEEVPKAEGEPAEEQAERRAS
jgi:hypothetical protein